MKSSEQTKSHFKESITRGRLWFFGTNKDKYNPLIPAQDKGPRKGGKKSPKNTWKPTGWVSASISWAPAPGNQKEPQSLLLPERQP